MVGSTSGPRIPAALQQIFLQSQKGEDVSKISAPSNGMGFKIFRRGWGKKRAATKAARIVKAPTTSSLASDRSVSSKDTAADASRKAMKKKNSSSKLVSRLRTKKREALWLASTHGRQ